MRHELGGGMVEHDPPLVYVAGAYRGKAPWYTERNIRRAEELGLQAAEQLGVMPMIPHTMTRFFDGTVSHEFWLKGTLRMMTVCDALLITPGWEHSSGTKAEIAEATRRKMPVAYELDELRYRLACAHLL